jgi:site-specific DNA recombinase
MLQNPIYTGDFLWLGKRQKGSHEALVSHDTFVQVQEVLGGKPRPRNKRRHAFMGLLTCERCGCAMTAEIKKGKYIYYRCTGFKGACWNAYIREERLAELMKDVIAPIQITEQIASEIATALRASDGRVEEERLTASQQLEQRRRAVTAKMDRAYEDLLSDRITEAFWTRHSAQWELEINTIDRELGRQKGQNGSSVVSAEKILDS